MEARLVRDELDKCQKTEGVNHYENCRWLSEKYLTMLKENKVRARPATARGGGRGLDGVISYFLGRR